MGLENEKFSELQFRLVAFYPRYIDYSDKNITESFQKIRRVYEKIEDEKVYLYIEK